MNKLYTEDEWLNLEKCVNQLKDMINARNDGNMQENRAYKMAIKILLQIIADYRID